MLPRAHMGSSAARMKGSWRGVNCTSSAVLMSGKMNLLPIDPQRENVEIETVNLAVLTKSSTATIFPFFPSFTLSCKPGQSFCIDVFKRAVKHLKTVLACFVLIYIKDAAFPDQ